MLATAAVGLLILAVASHLRFGSVSAGLQYVLGESLIVDRRSKTFGELVGAQQPTVEFQLTNVSEQPIRIVGARTQCTCIVAEDLPMTIGASNSARLKLRVRKRGRIEDIRENVRIFTDCAEKPEITVVVFGRISADSIAH